MSIHRFLLAVVVAGVCCATGESAATIATRPPETRTARPADHAPRTALARWPVLFVENRGQVDPRVAYYVPGRGTSAYFTSEGLTFALSRGGRRWAVKQDFVGARGDAHPVARDRRETVFSWFKGPRERWTTGVPTFGTIEYPELWPGIDMVCSATENRLKWLFVVKPGADPASIRFAWRGATSVRVGESGSLRVETPAGGFDDDAPIAFQESRESNVGRAPVDCAYAIDAAGGPPGAAVACGFRVGAYDRGRPLLIDPAVVVYAGYLGGDGEDTANGIAVDDAGNAYVTGSVASDESTFPVAAGPDLTMNGGALPLPTDAFVAKVRADGTGLAYCGFIGGDANDEGLAVAVDDAGNAYVAGGTGSTESTFPAAVGPGLTFNGNATDAFVAKVRADGTSLEYCGYVGGNGRESGRGIAVDDAGEAYVTGETSSSQLTFPVRVGPRLVYGAATEAFVAKVLADGTGLEYCGYIGGGGYDAGNGIAVDDAGSAYVTGETRLPSAGFPATVGPDLVHNGGGSDAFVAKVRADGTGFDWCGYLGGDGDDVGKGVAVDDAGNAYVAGDTDSRAPTFPAAVGPDVTFNGGFSDAFAAKVRADGTALDWCGYVGGFGADYALGIAVDGLGSVFVTGHTDSTEATFPVAAGPDLTFNEGSADAFVAKVNAGGSGFAYCGYVGGSDFDRGAGIAVDDAGNAYVAGGTSSATATFPATAGPDRTFNGAEDAFVVKVGATSGGGTSGTLDLAVVKGKLKDGTAWERDTFKASGTLAFNDGAPDEALDPAADGLEVSFGAPGDPCVVLVPAGATGWKAKRGKSTWKSARGETPAVKLTLDVGRGKFAIKAKSFDFPAATEGQVRVSVSSGNDTGSREDAWSPHPRKPGVLQVR